MLQRLINSDNRKFTLYVTIKCKTPGRFRVVTAENGKPNARYHDRPIRVKDQRTIFLSFPVSPKQVVLSVYNISNAGAEDFEVILEQKALRHYAVWLDEDTRNFLDLAVPFSQVCGFTNVNTASGYKEFGKGKFRIRLFNQIVDYMSGQPINTPARIGHNTGIIEIAKSKFDGYTEHQRMAILLHEFSHVFRNPKNNLPVSNEQGADINSLYIYLGLGFSKVDAIYVYANVFLKAQTRQNIERMRVIMDYINRFEAGEFAAITV